MNIEVTQRHIDTGQQREPDACAIALAIVDAVDWCTDACVVTNGDATLFDALATRVEEWVADAGAAKFIDDYDNEFPVSPFSFELMRNDNA